MGAARRVRCEGGGAGEGVRAAWRQRAVRAGRGAHLRRSALRADSLRLAGRAGPGGPAPRQARTVLRTVRVRARLLGLLARSQLASLTSFASLRQCSRVSLRSARVRARPGSLRCSAPQVRAAPCPHSPLPRQGWFSPTPARGLACPTRRVPPSSPTRTSGSCLIAPSPTHARPAREIVSVPRPSRCSC